MFAKVKKKFQKKEKMRKNNNKVCLLEKIWLPLWSNNYQNRYENYT